MQSSCTSREPPRTIQHQLRSRAERCPRISHNLHLLHPLPLLHCPSSSGLDEKRSSRSPRGRISCSKNLSSLRKMRKEERTLDFSLNKILIPRELVLKILCEALITVAHDQKGEPDRWGDRTLPSAFSMKLAPLDEPQHPTPVGVRDGLKDLAASARVACVCKALRELTQGELFEEMLQRLEEDFEKGSPKPEQTEGGGLARADHGLPQIDLKSTQEYTQYVMKRGPKPPHLQYFDADGSLKFEYRQFIDPRHREDWATTTTSGKYRLLLEHVDRCCKRLYTVLSDEAGVEYVTNSLVGDSDWRMVVTPPFVRRLLYNCFSDYLREGTTEGIDYWDLLVGGWFNFPYSDTMNREIVWESFEDEIGPDW